MSSSTDLLLQAGPAAILEFFPRRRSDREHHANLRGLAVAEWASLFRGEIAGRTVYAFVLPPSCLNPAYWVERSEEVEREMREKLGGIVEREDRGVRSLWRADRVPQGRALREGLGGAPEILPGPVFKFAGRDFLRAAEGLTEPAEPARILVAASPLNGQDRQAALLPVAADDLRHVRITLAEERMMFAAEGDGSARLAFAEASGAQRVLEGVLRGLFHRLSGKHVALIRRQLLADLLRLADGVGLFADPARDFVDKDRSLELTMHLGATGWPPERELPAEDPRVLLYYDRTSGIWEAIAQ
jgi:hypothetical protein